MKFANPTLLVTLRAGLCVLLGLTPTAAQQEAPASETVARSIKAIGYQVNRGDTRVDLKGAPLMPGASGEAKVEAKQGVTEIEAQVQGLLQPAKLGSEFLTYVLWVSSPDGRTSNVGEILIDDSGKGKLNATTQLQTFSLLVTAEPYFAVRQPSEVLVLENEIRKDTKGKIFIVNDYKLMRRSHYEKLGNPLALTLDLKNVPLEMYQARNAVDIARLRGADQHAPEIFTKAESSLKMAENTLTRKANKKDIISAARQAVQFSEDARALAVERQEAERVEQERQAAADKAKAEAEAKAAAEAAEAKRKSDEAAEEAKRKADAEAAEAKRKADEEARRQAELAAARQAQIRAEAEAAQRRADEEARRQAELAAAREAQLKAESEAAAMRAQAEADALKAKEEAAKAEAERARLAAEQANQAAEALRAQLLEQFNRILETRDTARGLVINLSDVLFDTGKYDLRPITREKLARLSGILLGHPGLSLEVEGHTDSTGSDELNQKLSEQRAEAVRGYLVEQGLAPDKITSKGFGKSMPVADNNTAAGRQQNRRVELIVSGEIIGTALGK